MVILATIFIALVRIAISAIVGGVAIMLIAGGLHSEVFPQLPAWSLRQSILMAIALAIVGSFFISYSSSSD